MTSLEFPPPGAAVTSVMQGPVAPIEIQLASPRTAASTPGCLVICHPHPLMGGAMSNKVVYTLAAAAGDCGLHSLRFNFRGVGRSGGVHDQGNGETSDTIFLVQQAQQALPGARVALAGFSFGAHVSLRAAAQLQPPMLISIAPPFGKYASGAPPQGPQGPWLAVHGLDDEVVNYEETRAALLRYTPAPELVTLDGVGHFFHGRLTELRGIVGAFIQRHW